MIVIPAWLDEVPNTDFSAEKELLAEIETWAGRHGWTVSTGADLPAALRLRTDVLLDKPDEGKRIRLAVLQKSRASGGEIRVDSSDLIGVELKYNRAASHWRVEVAGVRIDEDLQARGLDWLFGLVFQR